MYVVWMYTYPDRLLEEENLRSLCVPSETGNARLGFVNPSTLTFISIRPSVPPSVCHGPYIAPGWLALNQGLLSEVSCPLNSSAIADKLCARARERERERERRRSWLRLQVCTNKGSDTRGPALSVSSY